MAFVAKLDGDIWMFDNAKADNINLQKNLHEHFTVPSPKNQIMIINYAEVDKNEDPHTKIVNNTSKTIRWGDHVGGFPLDVFGRANFSWMTINQ